MPRYDTLTRDQMSTRQREVADAIASGPRGSLRGPFLALIHRPDLADHVQSLGEYLRYGTGLPADLVELAVIVTARRWSCDIEWNAHSRLAREAGVPDAVIDAVAANERPAQLTPEQAAVHDFAHETVWRGYPTDAAFEAAAARLGRPATLDLLGLCGYYSMLAFVLNTAQLPLPAGGQSIPPLKA